MHRRCFLLFISATLFAFSLFAQEEDGWLSLGRLSASTSATYHYAPWKAYNASLTLAQDAIRYTPRFLNPDGQLEKVLGDASYDVTIAYRIVSTFSMEVSAGILQVESHDSFRYALTYPVYVHGATILNGEPLIQQNLALNSPHFGIGMRYTSDVSSLLHISVSAVLERHSGSLKFNYRYEFPGSSDLFGANLGQPRFGARATCAVSLALDQSFRIVAGVDYRWLKFTNLQGRGTYTSVYSYTDISSHAFDAQLGEGNGYFGLHIAPKDEPYIPVYILHGLWSGSAAGPWWQTQPTSLDISGIGMTIGVQYAF